MTIHENQLILPGDEAIEAFVTQLFADPEMEPVNRLAALRDRHAATFAEAVRFQANAKELEALALSMDESKASTQRVHIALSEKIRTNEDKVFNVFMNTKGIEEVRALHGVRTEKVVRRKAIDWLMDQADYRKWLKDLGELQKELEAFPSKIEKVVKKATKAGKEAKAQFLKAGELLTEIRALEAELNA